ncbi:class A beta-lactamase-related serine hydrolase [Mucilaginibacter terrigena]|uniref:Class A beta-lactamase-related serine hydrolase n=1 Tax=Mucilaginibacter terrigena TaxID=2492395 RepID=A0A4Q5LL49_9SPHI|nr:serine hydrolase domain-containing protein [Mucilaginibacter terrigena]RYU90348.1 class A beta-lactamase-related serine hydrolase [Mucilaginibacter terrigena]
MMVPKLVYKYIKVFCLLALLCLTKLTAYGQQASKAQQINAYIKQKLANGGLPGLAIAVVHYDTVILAKGYGKTSAGKLIDANTPFAIASLSKAFTAAAVLQLTQAGKINLNNPVKFYIPSFKIDGTKGDKITVSQLLHQISGMGDTGYPEFTLDKQPGNLDEVITNMQSAKLVTEPGKAYHYHNPNYQVLAKIVEAVSHKPFGTYVRDNIFSPLKMVNTYDVDNTARMFNTPYNLPRGHIYILGKPVAINEPDWFVEGDAGVVSTVDDMAKWLSDQLKATGEGTSPVLGKKYLAMMQSAPARNNFNYGMGWHVSAANNVLYHSGIYWTYSSQQIILTDKGYGITILFNGGFKPLTDYYSLLQGVQDILAGKKADATAFPIWVYTVGVIILLVLIASLCTRRMFRVKQWHVNYLHRPKWRTWLYMLLRLVPLVLLLLIPYLLTAISGRVLSMGRITLMFMDLVLVMGLWGMLNLLIVSLRSIYLAKHKQAVKA